MKTKGEGRKNGCRKRKKGEREGNMEMVKEREKERINKKKEYKHGKTKKKR